jgi:hypothetical protein
MAPWWCNCGWVIGHYQRAVGALVGCYGQGRSVESETAEPNTSSNDHGEGMKNGEEERQKGEICITAVAE